MRGKIILVERQCRLRCRENRLEIEDEDGSRSVFLEDIAALVLASREISVSVFLLGELAALGVTVIVCDQRKFPHSSLLPLYGTGCAFRRAKEQCRWEREECDSVWAQVTRDKLRAQRSCLELLGLGAPEPPAVLPGDPSNAEGRYAELYFRTMFGRNFRRGLDDDINAALNYGYVVLTSAAARIAAAHGYMPFIGFHHIGEANNVNLACDCVEPFRPLVDFAVRLHLGEELDKPLKARLLSALNMTVRYGERRMAASDAMDGYFLDLMRSLKEKKIVTKELKVL